jgi:hypothetical protein
VVDAAVKDGTVQLASDGHRANFFRDGLRGRVASRHLEEKWTELQSYNNALSCKDSVQDQEIDSYMYTENTTFNMAQSDDLDKR